MSVTGCGCQVTVEYYRAVSQTSESRGRQTDCSQISLSLAALSLVSEPLIVDQIRRSGASTYQAVGTSQSLEESREKVIFLRSTEQCVFGRVTRDTLPGWS